MKFLKEWWLEIAVAVFFVCGMVLWATHLSRHFDEPLKTRLPKQAWVLLPGPLGDALLCQIHREEQKLDCQRLPIGYDEVVVKPGKSAP